MEVIDIGVENLEPVSIDKKDNGPSVNFGPGIELLMNDKSSSSKGDVNLNLDDLDSLEKEMNDLSSSINVNTEEKKDPSPTPFSFVNEPPTVNLDDINSNISDSNLGNATRESLGNTKTWDGFTKLNEVPNINSSSGSSKLSDREKRRKKRHMIKKLEEWHEKKLISSSSHFTMESEFDEIEDEYETALDDKRKKDSVKLQGWWFMTFVNSLEYGNAVFDPFGLNLDGWGEQVSEDLDSYEEIFGELHDKYKGGKLAPEISLLLRVGFSAAVLNFSNKALASATPGFNDVIKQSPELMKMFTQATADTMSQNSGAFEMANQFMQSNPGPRGPPPPAPVETKNQAPPQRPGMVYTERASNRPDIDASRGAMFREQGVEINNFESANSQHRPPQPSNAQPKSARSRPEMKGPQSGDLDDILSGLKTRKVDIHETKPTGNDNDSVISIHSLSEMAATQMPKKSKKKNNSEKNTISLDI